MNKLFKNKPDNLNREHVIILMYNLLCAIHFLHSANVIHRDIKPANILTTEQCEIKICDFGISRSICPSVHTKQETLASDENINEDTALKEIKSGAGF